MARHVTDDELREAIAKLTFPSGVSVNDCFPDRPEYAVKCSSPECGISREEYAGKFVKGLCLRCYQREWVRTNKLANKCVDGCGRVANAGFGKCRECRWGTEKKRLDNVKGHHALRAEVIRILGGRCWCCYESNYHLLTIDHVQNDGAEHRKRVGNNSQSMYRDILSEGAPRDRYRLACWNCNSGRAVGPGGQCHSQEHREALRKTNAKHGRQCALRLPKVA